MLTMTIDHPLDPENYYLAHAAVGSPELLNMYSGTAILDDRGSAVMELPSWFEALNGEVRYQLTAIGAAAPNFHIARELRNSSFAIAGGKRGMKVSWQVTGVRHDPYAVAHPLAIQAAKPANDRGSYLHPQEHGEPATKGRENVRIQYMWGEALSPQ